MGIISQHTMTMEKFMKDAAAKPDYRDQPMRFNV